MTVSKVTLASVLVEAVCGMEVSSRASSFSDLRLQHEDSRGRVFRKMLTIRIFTGNMMRELWTPTMNCCQVNSKWPGNRREQGQILDVAPDVHRKTSGQIILAFLGFSFRINWAVVKKCCTQVHGLLGGIGGDAIKHDAGQHGAEQQGETAGNSLDTSEGAARWSTDHGVPEVSVTEILWCLHEKQITAK